jgi:hypothetical protein
MFYHRRVFASLLVIVAVTLTIVLAQMSGVAVAQEGVSRPGTGNPTVPTAGSLFVGADNGMPAFYACEYGDWGCDELAAPAAFIGADSGMPAFYACQYGHWGCAEPAASVTFVEADSGMPAFYACQYGYWGC